MAKKIGGTENTRYENFLEQFLLNNGHIYKYEIKTIIKAFKLTILWFLENCEEFEIKDFFKLKKIHKEDHKIYVRYRSEWDIIPEHDDMKMETSKNLRDYLNHRRKFKDAKHRNKLPDGTTKYKDIY